MRRIIEKPDTQRLLCGPPFETRPEFTPRYSRGAAPQGEVRSAPSYGSFIPATVTISPHFLVSLAWKAASSSGVPGNGRP